MYRFSLFLFVIVSFSYSRFFLLLVSLSLVDGEYVSIHLEATGNFFGEKLKKVELFRGAAR